MVGGKERAQLPLCPDDAIIVTVQPDRFSTTKDAKGNLVYWLLVYLLLHYCVSFVSVVVKFLGSVR
jgi:hypothetical protein